MLGQRRAVMQLMHRGGKAMRLSSFLCVMVTCLSLALSSSTSLAQQATPDAARSASNHLPSEESATANINRTPETKTHGGRQLKVLSSLEFGLSILVLVFGCIVLIIEYLQLRAIRVTAEDSLRIYAVTLIIVATLFSITAGFDAVQVAPAMGLFGTIAGYLLGKRSEKSRNSTNGNQAPRKRDSDEQVEKH